MSSNANKNTVAGPGGDTDTVAVIELRQKTSDNVFDDGDWQTTLREERILYPGDSVALRNAFIDTKSSSSDTIKLDEPLTISIENIVYNKNHENVGGKKSYYSSTVNVGIDGQPYILCTSKNTKNDPFYTEIVSYPVKKIESKPKDPGDTFELELRYKDVLGNTVKWHSDKIDRPKNKGETVTVNVGLITGTDSVSVLNTLELLDAGLQVLDPKTAPVTEDTITPKIFGTTITIDAGTYDPSDIARIITDKLSVGFTGDYIASNELVFSSFLHSSDKYNGQGAFGATPGNESAPFVRSDLGAAFQYANNSARWIGTNQMALEYDNETQKFKWSDIHMPIYIKEGQIVTQYVTNAGDPNNGELFVADAYSGIAFTKLEPVSFWRDVLGFDLGSILATLTYETTTIDTIIAKAPIITLTPGVNITGQYTGLDAAIKKDVDFYAVPNPPPASTSAITTPIYAANAFGIAGVRDGYFLIDINAKMKNDVIGQELKSTSISGIISRYYSADSYTSGTASDSIPYIHRGIGPILLDSMRIRILNPDGTLATDIGDDNTVFLQIVHTGSGA